MIMYDWQHKIILDALEEYKKNNLMQSKSIDMIKTQLDEILNADLFIFKKTIGHSIINTNISAVLCPICSCEKATTKHHIIPLRMMMPNNPLKKLKIKICKKCHQAIHPENVYIDLFNKLIPIVEDMCGKEIEQISTWHKIKGLAKGQWTKNHLREFKELEI